MKRATKIIVYLSCIFIYCVKKNKNTLFNGSFEETKKLRKFSSGIILYQSYRE